MEKPPVNYKPIPSGSFITPLYVERQKKVYGVDENELNHISSLNTQASVFFSVMSILFTLSFSLLIEGVNTDTPTTAVALLFKYGTPITAAIGVIFLVLGLYNIRTKNSMLKTIKEESSANESQTSNS